MSKTQSNPRVCANCGDYITLAEGKPLVMACECSERPIRVSKANPEGW